MWTVIISLGLKFVDWFLSSRAKDKESREAFLQLVGSLSKQGLISKSLHDSYESQRDKNKQELGKS